MCRHYIPESLLPNGSNCGGLSTVGPSPLIASAWVGTEHNAGLQFADTGIATSIASCDHVSQINDTETQFSEVEKFDLANCIMEGGDEEENGKVNFDQEMLT